MGIDIYRLSNNKRLAVTTTDGSLVRPYVYGQKVTYNWDYERRQQQWIERCHAACPDGSGFVTIPSDWKGKVKEGDPVYYMERLCGVWYDCDAYPGKCVGYLRKVGRGKWDILSQEAAIAQRAAALVSALPLSRRLLAEQAADTVEEALNQADIVMDARVENGVLSVHRLPSRVKDIYDARDSLRGALAGSGYL